MNTSKRSIMAQALFIALVFITLLGAAFWAKAGEFNPTPVQQFGLTGTWYYRVDPQGPIVAGNGFFLEVSYNELQRPILIAEWSRVTNISLSPGKQSVWIPDKGGGSLMLSWAGTGIFTDAHEVSSLLFLSADSSCQENVSCGSFVPLGDARFTFHSCTSATMVLQFNLSGPLKDETLFQEFFLVRGTEPQQCGSQ